MTTDLWTEEERQAWMPEERLAISEWAAENRYLPQGQTDIPGQWRNENAPYLRGMMDLADKRGITSLNICKASQLGVSEAFRNVMLAWADQDPDPMGLGLPSKEKGRQIVSKRVKPAFKQCDAIQHLIPDKKWALTKQKIRLTNGFQLMLMWSGSATATSAEPMRRVINDEVDKFQAWGGTEPSPIMRTWKRMRTFGDRKMQVNISTPTTRQGRIWQLVTHSDVVLSFCVPCPSCGTYQALSFRQLRFPKPEEKQLSDLSDSEKRDLAANIRHDRATWYECKACEYEIKPDEKTEMVRAGRWMDRDSGIEDAESVDSWPRGTSVGMKINALYGLWEDWSDVVSEFLHAEGDRGATYNFRTETCGLPWEEQIDQVQPSLYAGKCARSEREEGVAPEWAEKLIASIDTQHDHFYMVLRAWGPDMKSARVWHGRVQSFKELDSLCFNHAWSREGRQPLKPELVVIDSGGTQQKGEEASRTMHVYRWSLRRRSIVRPLKGAGDERKKKGRYIWKGKGYLGGQTKEEKLDIWYIDPHHWGDMLYDLAHRGLEDDGEEVWLLNENNDDAYNMQLSNVNKVTEKRGGNLVQRWRPKSEGAADHYWDCEVYQIAAAHMAQVHLLPSQEELDQMRSNKRSQRNTNQSRSESSDSGFTVGGGWDVGDMEDYI